MLHPADVLELAPGFVQPGVIPLATAVPDHALADAPVRAQRAAPMIV